MFGDGKRTDIIIRVLPRAYENQPSMFSLGGIVTLDYDRLMVWCEHGYKSVLEKVAGVFNVAEDQPEPRYVISVDPRYDTQWVIKEIEAAVKITEPKKEIEDTKGVNFFGRLVLVDDIHGQPKKRKKVKKKG